MSTSPTRPHYYASRPSSRSASRPTSPPTSAEVRSQAVAKLKRAASLPRKPDGRRPSFAPAQQQRDKTNESGPSSPLTIAQHPTQNAEEIFNNSNVENQGGSSSLNIDSSHQEQQEVLSPSPVATSFDHAAIYPTPTSATPLMQRSASAASSSYHMPLGATINTPFYPNTPPAADWAAMQLAQSYLPSLTPTGLSPNPYPHSVPIGVGAGPSTPSPLPTLGELATLQRSNSNAARAKAMSKLTGGRGAPPDEDITLSTPSRVGANLTRAGTLGGVRMLDLAALRTRPAAAEEPAAVQASVPDAAFAEARPRLQRSFTVSSSNMGEERRSAVGRRMVERLAERRAARQKEEEEVRQLWEERRAAMERDGHDHQHRDGPEEGLFGAHQEQVGDEREGDYEHVDEHDDNIIPALARTSPAEPHRLGYTPQHDPDMLGAPERPVSRGTMQSSQEPFEYESHLRRSLSSRTARGVVGDIVEPVPAIVTPENHTEHIESPILSEDVQVADEPLLPPYPQYATPSRHVPHSSTSTESTIPGNQSPGGSSLSGLDSMMFVMGGSGAPGPSGLKPGQNQHWPQDAHDGSEWGTPAKDLHQATFTDSPILHSPSDRDRASGAESHSGRGSVEGGDQLTPPSRGSIRTDSVMSWEEVGGKEDQEVRVPTDKTYHQKSGSFSAKLKGSVRSAMKKRSHSRSSITSITQSPPMSPAQLQVSGFPSRRGSESSTSPSHRSATKDHTAKHQPSISSLSASLSGQPDTSANAALLQHQLSNDPSQVSFLPRATLNDPRILSSKLSPFPGIARLEARKNDESLSPGEAPKLFHQLSDSVIPSQQRSTSIPSAQESIYALPLPAHTDDRRASADSATKRNWLSKAFGHSTSPRSSGSVSRKSSSPDFNSLDGAGRTLGQGAQIITAEVDPFAAPPPPTSLSLKPAKHRSASPSVSVVPEVSEEGSRFTRFASMRGDNGTPALPEIVDPDKQQEILPRKSEDVLNRMDEVLAMGPDDPARPDILDDPPRKLLLSTQILQVVNVHTVKDRYLFLFNDILVIAKPLISQGITATLDMNFVVKSIVSLDKLAISGFAEEPKTEPERHPVVNNFIQRFAEDPVEACAYLVERSSPKVDPVTLASLIFKTPELDKTRIGELLADNDKLMKSFIDRFHFAGVRIDEAFRMFLLSLRLPTEPTACETLLRGFAHTYFEANHNLVSFDREVASDLVLAIIQFNDALYGTFGFALPNHAITKDTFISAFSSKDPHGLVSEELLAQIYDSIRATPLSQALNAEEQRLQGRIVQLSPARIPTKLTYNVWSEKITVSIPQADDQFQIKLFGEGLEFEPAVLDFENRSEASFRVRGTSLGTKSLLFNRVGNNAALYGGLGNTRHFTIERAFMKHTFHVAFANHNGLKRKYCFSVDNLETRRRWGTFLDRHIKMTKAIKSQSASTVDQKIRQTAEGVSIQVLRDALIPPEDKLALPVPSTSGGPARGNGTSNRLGSSALARRDTNVGPDNSPGRGGGSRPSTSTDRERGRAGSVSIAYAQHAYKDEYDLGPLQPTRGGGNTSDKQSGMLDIQTGKELVLLCRQNSLLPGLLELLHAGKEGAEGMVPVAAPAPPANGMSVEMSNQGSGAGMARTDSVRNKGVRV
ncbi:hypothetical protein I317_06021 [Kwoniella heveanensis CBS 569]|nr:hypothetical protein I317_06021 [Kwoniella heveanensis CBS 569]